MLLRFVFACWIISVGIGLYAATRVQDTRDFAIAGSLLPDVAEQLHHHPPQTQT